MSWYDTAEDILNGAVNANATRVAFFSEGSYVLAEPNLESLQKAFQKIDIPSAKYKFQEGKPGDFSDITKYKFVFNRAKFEAAAISTDFLNVYDEEIMQTTFLMFRDESRRAKAIGILKKIKYNFVTSQYLKLSPTKALSCIDHLSKFDLSSYDEECITYFVEYMIAFSLLVLLPSEDRTVESLERKVQELDYSFQSVSDALNNLFGQVASVQSRAKAVNYFSKITNKQLISDFYLDTGVLTYYLLQEDKSTYSERLLEVQRLHDLSESKGADLCILFSCDLNFAKIYLPVMFSYVAKLPDIHFHVILVGEVEDLQAFNNVVSQLKELFTLTSGREEIDNFSSSHAQVPAWVAEAKTYYACARYLLADRFLERYSSVYIMDMDITFREDPTAYFKELAKQQVAFPMSRNLTVIAPWRRYMAGNFLIGNSEPAMEFLSNVASYLSVGLQLPNSWMLDQNAIAYAVEVTDVKPFDIGSLKRPNEQPKINKLFEQEYFRRLK